MAFAPPPKNKQPSTQLAKSTWTPMNNSETNKEVFEERRTIIKKWFQKWNEKQRRAVIEDIFQSISEKHLLAVHVDLGKKFPEEKHDFTKRMPRVLSLYVFSFLDPRSLSRCAQVSWYWKYLTELDCIWRPKCLRFGWYPTHQPSPYEETVWKRHYIATIYKLHYVKAKGEPKKEDPSTMLLDTSRTDKTQLSTARSHMSSASASRRKKAAFAPKNVPIPGPKWEPPPWKGSDPSPTDTMRYNYLDNKQRKAKSKNPRRPKSASGSLVLPSKKGAPSPVKSSMEPRPSSAAHSVKNSTVTQSFDPQALRNDNKHMGTSEHISTVSARNVMSASVSNFSYTGSPNLHGTTNGDATLEASTYYVNSTSPIKPSMGGTLNSTAHYTSALHGQNPPAMTPLQSSGVPDISPNMKDATIRPKPAVKLSTDKSLTLSTEKLNEKSNETPEKPIKKETETPPIKKPIAAASDYRVKEASSQNGKSTPLKGSPWKTKEVGSDESDF